MNPNPTGPGDYDVDKADTVLKANVGNFSFSACKGGEVGGESKPKAPTPGPGWYDLGSAGEISSAGAGSAFRSASSRIGGNSVSQIKPPGPAYYNIKTAPVRRTFHLNVDSKWI